MSALTQRVQETRKLYDMYDVLGVSARKRKIVCPLPMHYHQDQPTPSFSIFFRSGVQTFKCHGNCGMTGDVVDLVGYINIPGYREHDPSHTDMAVSILEGGYRISIPRPPKIKRMNSMAWKDYLPLRKDGRSYAYSRGLADYTIDKFKLGQYKNFLAIPAFFEGACVGIKFRNMLPKEQLTGDSLMHQRFWNARGTKSTLFNIDDVAYTRFPLLILKGEIPVMIADQLGFLACGYTAGEGMDIAPWLPQLAFSARKIFVGDNDSNPEVDKRMKGLIYKKAEMAKGIAKFPPPEFHDFDEWLLRNPDAIKEVREWMS